MLLLLLLVLLLLLLLLLLFSSDGASGVKIRAGDHRLSNTDGSEQTIAVETAFVHPQYNDDTTHNDIALIKLAQDLTFNDFVQPACLPVEGQFFLSMAKIFCWGL